MPIAISLVFDDGYEQPADQEFEGFADSVRFGLDLADRLGRSTAGDGHGPPVRVRIYQGGITHLLVMIIEGGLGIGRDRGG